MPRLDTRLPCQFVPPGLLWVFATLPPTPRRDPRLPWQFVLLGLLWFFATLLALLVLAVHTIFRIPAAQRSTLLTLLVQLLIALAIATPPLAWFGHQKRRQSSPV